MSTQARVGVDITAQDKTAAAFASATQKIQRFGSIAGSALKGFAAGFSATAIMRWLKATVDAMDEMADAAQRMGVGIESMTALAYAAKLNGASFETLQQAAKKLNDNLSDIAAGKGGDAGRAMAAMGLSVRDAGGNIKSVDQVITEAAGKFSRYKDGADKAALATALFGKAGTDMLPMLNAGSEAIREATAEAETFGLVLRGPAADAAQTFNDNMDRVGALVLGVAQDVVSAFLPAVNETIDKLLEVAKSADIAGNSIKVLGEFFEEGGKRASTTMQEWDALSQSIMTVYRASSLFLGGASSLAIAELQKGGAGVADKWTAAAKAIEHVGHVSNMAQKMSLPKMGPAIEAPTFSRSEAVAKKVAKKAAIKKPEFNQFDHPLYGGDLSDWQRSMKEMADAMDPVKDQAAEVRGLFQGWFDSAIQDGFKLKNVLQSLEQATQRIASKAFENVLGGLFSQGDHPLYGGGGLNGLFNNLFKNLPSFAVGADRVPRDMVAKIHEGEMIVPAAGANALRSGGLGGGGVTIIDQRSNAPAVEQRQDGNGNLLLVIRDMVRNEMPGQLRKAMPATFGLRPSMTDR